MTFEERVSALSISIGRAMLCGRAYRVVGFPRDKTGRILVDVGTANDWLDVDDVLSSAKKLLIDSISDDEVSKPVSVYNINRIHGVLDRGV